MSLYDVAKSRIESVARRARIECIQTHSLYIPALGPDSVVVDLGANFGTFSHAMADRFGARCFAIEAMRGNLDQIPDHPRIEKFHLAVSDHDGPVRMFESENPEANSIFEGIAGQYQTRATTEVPGVRLETFLAEHKLSTIDVLKLDIEGAEKLVFDSTSDGTLRQVKQLTIEFHDWFPDSITEAEVAAICRRMTRLGFLCLPFSYLIPCISTADILFLNTRLVAPPIQDWLRFRELNLLLNLVLLKAKFKGEVTRPESSAAPLSKATG